MAKRSNEPDEVVSYWLKEIGSSRKRERDFRKEGKRILEIYSGEKSDVIPFNILFSNTETLLPALYSQVPRPIVQRRFKDEDPVGKSASLAGQRVLEFLLDTNVEGYETFDQGMRSSTLDGLLPGRGITCIKYDAVVSDVKQEDGSELPVKSSELVCVDTKSWDRVFFGYAKKWSKVPWIAYEEHIDKQEAERLFGETIANKIEYTTGEDEEKEDHDKSEEKDKGERKTALIYQIWDKDGGKDGGKKIRYISPQYKDGYLKVEEDPLELTGFFNCPKPLMFVEKSNDLMPTALYKLYENQAKELNKLTVRINRIVDAIKARGVYDTELGEELGNLMKADDNALIPADKSSSLAAEKGLGNAIWFMPVEQLVNVLRELYVAREQCKQVIYEITGIADILRGSSKASETLGAQQIKEKWGGLRLKRLQKEVQRYSVDMLRMMLEVAATKFSEDTWAKMTGLPFVTSQQKMQLSQIAMAAQSSGQELDPQTQSMLKSPVWDEVLKVLKNDVQRAYRIDIETNSTVEPEAVEDQKNIAELMTALGQYLNGVGPLVQKGALPMEAAQSMLLAITRRFRFGSEIEDYIKQMKAPPPEDNGKAAEAQKMQMEAQKTQMDQQQKQTEMNHQMQMDQMKLQNERETEQSRIQFESAKLQAEQAIQMEKIQAEERSEAAKLRMEKEMRLAELQAERETEKMKALLEQDTELKKAAMQSAAQIHVSNNQSEMQLRKEAGQKEDSATNQSASMESIMKLQKELLDGIRPKRVDIVRDKNGFASSIVPVAMNG